MPDWAYILIAILIIVALIAIFFISYYFNKKTPVPKGCEDLLISEENCASCSNTSCTIRKKEYEEENKEEK